MRVGIDVQARNGPKTGLGVYTENLVQALLQERRNGYEFCFFEKDEARDWNTLRRLFWENSELPAHVRANRVEILHVPAFAPPLVKPCRTVVTVHDLIGMVFPNQLGWPSRFYWGQWLPLAVKRADALIADSENTKKDIMKFLRISEKKITVIYPSGHEGFRPLAPSEGLLELRKRVGFQGKYFLAVGTLEPRKNIARVIQAFLRFLEKRGNKDPQFHLILVGSKEFAHGRFYDSLLGSSADWARIHFTGYLEKKDLNVLYSGAEAFVFPSLYEGFGIPVLEAMASGTPVITSRTSSLPEVAGDAVTYVDPYDVEALAGALETMESEEELRKGWIQKGFARIQRFSWRRTVKETLSVYETVLGG